MKISQILSLTVALNMASMPALAQRQIMGDEQRPEAVAFAPHPGQDETPSEERREEVRKKIEAVRIWRLTEELKLEAVASAQLSSLLSALDLKRRTKMREQVEAMRDLRILLKNAKPDETKLKSLLNNLDNNHHELQDLKEQELNRVKEILTLEQQARFMIFQQEFQREIQGMITGVRNKGQDRARPERGPDRRGKSMNTNPDRDLQFRPPR